MRTADTEMNMKHENYLSRSEKLGLKKLKPAWVVVLITAKIACIFIGANFIKSIFQNPSFLFF